MSGLVRHKCEDCVFFDAGPECDESDNVPGLCIVDEVPFEVSPDDNTYCMDFKPLASDAE